MIIKVVLSREYIVIEGIEEILIVDFFMGY